MKPLATDEEQVAFWRRHTRLGVTLSVVLPAVAALHTYASPAAPRDVVVYVLAAAVAGLSPLLLLVPVDRVARNPRGRLFFDAWEAVGIVLVSVFALLDGGASSPYVMFFYVLLAHAALAYPPAGMALAGACSVAAYLTVGTLAGDASSETLTAGALTMVVATGTCAFASYNHVRVYRRTVAYAQRIAVLAERDGLTGCLNHRTFHGRLQAEAGAADRGRPLSLLIVDVDSFKQVNDSLGHPAGDEVLRLIGETLLALSRADDAAGRLGGDEFALLLPATTAAEAAVVAERLRGRVRSADTTCPVTVSVGVATTTARADGSGLLAEADHAVYRAKRGGRDQVAGRAAETAALPPHPRFHPR